MGRLVIRQLAVDAHGDSKEVPNVFVDVGFPPEEAAHLLIRALLVTNITDAIKRRRLTQKQAAKLLHVTQPRISDLVRRHLDRFTIDTLVEMLTRLGMEVTVRAKARARRARVA